MNTRVKPNGVVIVRSPSGPYTFTPTWTPQLYADTTSEAGKSDQAWFKNNPDRRHHLRAFMDGDDPDLYDHSFVLRRDPEGLRIIPVPAEFIPPDEENYAEVLYLMSLEVITASARAALTGEWEELTYIDQDQYVRRVLTLQKLRRFLLI